MKCRPMERLPFILFHPSCLIIFIISCLILMMTIPSVFAENPEENQGIVGDQVSQFIKFNFMITEMIEFSEPEIDLSVLELETPGSAYPDQHLSEGVSLRIENQGIADAGGFGLGVYLSDDPVISSDDILLEGGQQTIDGLSADASIDLPASEWMVHVPADFVEGPYF